MRSIGLDLSSKAIDWCEARDGEVVARGRVADLDELDKVLGAEPALVAFEACRESRHVYALLKSWGHTPMVVDTTRVKMLGVGHHGRKNDRLDAEALALAVDRGWIPQAHVLGNHAHELRELQEMHRALTDSRTRMVTHVRGLARGRGVSLPSCATESFAENLQKAQLPPELRKLVEPLLQVLQALQPQLLAVDLRIHELLTQEAEQQDVLVRLATVPGVSLLVAAAFISVIDEPSRFERASQASSYLGLCPRENTTGYRQQLGRITKHGNSYARWMLVQAAWAVVRSNDMTDPLVRWARKLKQRRGGMRTAVAVARRLSRILWALWRHGGVYDPASLAEASARGRANQAQQAQDEEQQLQHAIKIAQTRKRAEQKLGKKHRNLQRQLQRATASL